jgi:hypothetical protein
VGPNPVSHRRVPLPVSRRRCVALQCCRRRWLATQRLRHRSSPWDVVISPRVLYSAVITMVGIYILTHRKSDKEEKKEELELSDMTENPLADSPVAPPRRESLNRPRSRSIDFSVGFASLMATPIPMVGDDAVALSMMEAAVVAVDGAPAPAGGGVGGAHNKPRLSSVSETEATRDDDVTTPVEPAAPALVPRRSMGIIQGFLNMLPIHGSSGGSSGATSDSSRELHSAMLGDEGVVDDAPLTVPIDAPSGGVGGSPTLASVPAPTVHKSPKLPPGKSPRLAGTAAPAAAQSLHVSPELSPSDYHELRSPLAANSGSGPTPGLLSAAPAGGALSSRSGAVSTKSAGAAAPADEDGDFNPDFTL